TAIRGVESQLPGGYRQHSRALPRSCLAHPACRQLFRVRRICGATWEQRENRHHLVHPRAAREHCREPGQHAGRIQRWVGLAARRGRYRSPSAHGLHSGCGQRIYDQRRTARQERRGSRSRGGNVGWQDFISRTGFHRPVWRRQYREQRRPVLADAILNEAPREGLLSSPRGAHSYGCRSLDDTHLTGGGSAEPRSAPVAGLAAGSDCVLSAMASTEALSSGVNPTSACPSPSILWASAKSDTTSKFCGEFQEPVISPSPWDRLKYVFVNRGSPGCFPGGKLGLML